MTLTKYTLKLGLTDADLLKITEAADKGLGLEEIRKNKAPKLTVRQIYAILLKYSEEDGGSKIYDLYPKIHKEFIESLDETNVEKNIVISKNKRELNATYDDLNLKEIEAIQKTTT